MKKNLQNIGRSMVEMLAVLAIIGVLTVSLLFGFSSVRESYKVEEIIKDVQRQAALLGSWRRFPLKDGTTEIRLTYKSPTGVDFIRTANENNGTFAITAGKISQKLCEELVREARAKKIKVYVGDNLGNEKCAASDENSISFTFDMDHPSSSDEDYYYDYSPSSFFSDNSQDRSCPKGQIKNVIKNADEEDDFVCCYTYQYFAAGSCHSCPSYAICDGSSVRGCTNGTSVHGNVCCDTGDYWNGSSCTKCPKNARCTETSFSCIEGFIKENEYCVKDNSVNLGKDENGNDCQAGTYNDGSFENCQLCDAGYYSDSKGASACTPCPAGTYSSGKGSTSCTKCSAGEFSSGGSQRCSSCASGKWSNAGDTSCYSCSSGEYRGTNDIGCKKCSKGYFSEGNVSSCTPCPKNYFSDTTGAGQCKSCGENGYTDEEGQISCLCKSGYFKRQGENTCRACPAGTYKGSEDNSCLPCKPGEYSDAGSSSCKKCPAGTYSSEKGLGSCTKCPAGTYSTEKGATSSDTCVACPAGTYSTKTGIDSDKNCTKCPAGTYSTEEGATSEETCIACPEGTSLPGSTKCKSCPEYATCLSGEVSCKEGYTLNEGRCLCLSKSCCEHWNSEFKCCMDTGCTPDAECEEGYIAHGGQRGVVRCCNEKTEYWNGDNCATCPENCECDGTNTSCFDNTCPGGSGWNGAEYVCCQEGEVLVEAGNRGDYICCPEGTTRAIDRSGYNPRIPKHQDYSCEEGCHDTSCCKEYTDFDVYDEETDSCVCASDTCCQSLGYVGYDETEGCTNETATYCSYFFTEPVLHVEKDYCAYVFREPTPVFEYDCAYVFKEPVSKTEYDCAYTFTEPVMQDGDCAYKMIADTTTYPGLSTIKMMAGEDYPGTKECANKKMYCNLRFKENTSGDRCSTKADANTAIGSIIYGACSPMEESYTTCTKQLDVSNVLTLEKACSDTSSYCNLRYEESNCETLAATNKIGLIYGSCSKMNEADTQCKTPWLDMSNVLTVEKACSDNSNYCNLRYEESNCGTVAGASSTGLIYGACSPMEETNTECHIGNFDTSNVFTKIKSCSNSSLYCNLLYTNSNCETIADADANGLIYGACSPMSVSNRECYTQYLDTDEVLIPVESCADNRYCYLKYSDILETRCVDADAEASGLIYGTCLRPSSSSSICPLPSQQ